jgi:hypothetical protein
MVGLLLVKLRLATIDDNVRVRVFVNRGKGSSQVIGGDPTLC